MSHSDRLLKKQHVARYTPNSWQWTALLACRALQDSAARWRALLGAENHLQVSKRSVDAGAGATSPTSGIALVQDKSGRAMSMVNSAALEESAQGRDDMQDGEEFHFESEQHTPMFQVGVAL